MAKARLSSRRPSRRLRLWFAAAVAVLLVGGLYFGLVTSRPPARPDLATMVGKPEAVVGEPDSGGATRLQEAVRAPTEPNEAVSAPPPYGAVSVESVELARQPPPPRGTRPRVAVVIDDLGRSLRDLSTLGALGIELSYAVLPFESRTPEVVSELRRRGAEILCHLPMEAKGGANPGPGALLLGMSQEQLSMATRRALAAVPGAVGVNNHMGSGLTAQREAIEAVLTVVAEQRLFYLDSRTSADTLAYTLARRLGVPAGERQVFLDTERDRAFIRGQFEHLLEVARERGAAIAIGHPYPETLEILAEEVPRARAMGIEFVRASSLVEG